jgi:hypothetical protein
MIKIGFTARGSAEDREFVCERCSGQVIKLAAKQYARQHPYMMECKKCGLVSGGWDTNEERDRFLQEMPSS